MKFLLPPGDGISPATERAVDDLLADTATHTPDIGGSLGTGAYGDALASRIGTN